MKASAWRIFLQHIHPYRIRHVLLLLAIICAEAMSAIFVWRFSHVVDLMATISRPATAEQITNIHYSLIVVFVMIFITWCCWRTAGYLAGTTAPRVVQDLEYTAFSHLLKQSHRFFLDNFAGALVKKVKNFCSGFMNVSEVILWRITPTAVALISMVIIVSLRQPLIGLLIAIGISLAVAVNVNFFYHKYYLEKQRVAKDSEITGLLADVLTNQANVKFFASQATEKKSFLSLLKERTRLVEFMWLISEKSFFIQNIVCLTLEVVVMFYVLHLWLNQQIELGDFVLVQTYLFSLIAKFFDISKIIKALNNSLADSQEMASILAMSADIVDSKNAKKLQVRTGEIRFDQVAFHYQKEPVLDGFNLVIPAKEKLALVGPSGAGKSTIIKLLFRLYDIDKGTITIDGQNVATVKQESLWQQVSLVPQDPVLFHRSLLDNIRYGCPDATEEEVQAAARQAYCHDFISALPDGYQTFVGERGVKLSGGERQRVAIARAILKDSPILILDEATSSLDSASEQLIQAALKNLMKDKTAIVIAHRLSTIMQMDRIVVVDGGRIVDTGTHEELLAKDSLYRTLWNIQAGKYGE